MQDNRRTSTQTLEINLLYLKNILHFFFFSSGTLPRVRFEKLDALSDDSQGKV